MFYWKVEVRRTPQLLSKWKPLLIYWKITPQMFTKKSCVS
jgi:hypothetical protein